LCSVCPLVDLFFHLASVRLIPAIGPPKPSKGEPPSPELTFLQAGATLSQCGPQEDDQVRWLTTVKFNNLSALFFFFSRFSASRPAIAAPEQRRFIDRR
jgi:hypothetical protein